jgi:hypothetical protein
MAKMSKKKLQEIIEREEPGARLVEGATGRDADRLAATDFDTPDVSQLREKFLGSSDAAAGAESAESDEGDDDDEIAIVSVEKGGKTDPWDRASRAKAFVVSEKEDRVIGRQG